MIKLHLIISALTFIGFILNIYKGLYICRRRGYDINSKINKMRIKSVLRILILCLIPIVNIFLFIAYIMLLILDSKEYFAQLIDTEINLKR